MPVPAHVAGRMKVNRAAAKSSLRLVLEGVTDAEVDSALAGIDQDALYDQVRATWTTEVWDRKSPINGVPAQYFLDRDDVDENDDNDILLLKQNGQVVGFQPHEPDVPGLARIPKGQGAARGKVFADNIAADAAAVEVVDRVRRQILAARGN